MFDILHIVYIVEIFSFS